MWGPLVRLRRWLRPLPTIGWVFTCRREYGEMRTMRFFGRGGIRRTGVMRDILVPGDCPETALHQALDLARRHIGETVEIVAMRPADRRDFPAGEPEILIGPPSHFGFASPRRPYI